MRSSRRIKIEVVEGNTSRKRKAVNLAREERAVLEGLPEELGLR